MSCSGLDKSCGLHLHHGSEVSKHRLVWLKKKNPEKGGSSRWAPALVMSWLPATALLDPSHPTGLQHKFTFPGQVLPHIDNYHEAILTDSTPELIQSSSRDVRQDICPN